MGTGVLMNNEKLNEMAKDYATSPLGFSGKDSFDQDEYEKF